VVQSDNATEPWASLDDLGQHRHRLLQQLEERQRGERFRGRELAA
jgi:hypothetical protein